MREAVSEARPRYLFIALAAHGMAMAMAWTALGGETTSVVVGAPLGKHAVRYASGSAVYVEELANGRLVGRYGSADGRVNPAEFWQEPVFEIRVKTEPSPAVVPGALLDSGWQWVAARELPRTPRGARHAVVELAHAAAAVGLEVHTLLDGTAILTRYLQITNRSARPLALTGLAPWSGRLWGQDAPFALGHSERSQNQCEGWFGWQVLKPGPNVVSESRGLAADKPFFVLRNDATGQFAIGGLGWPVNYTMEFRKAHGLTFKIGPTAVDALRVIDPGETITTPSVHLGLIAGDFDAAVQAMHEHVRRSVCPPIRPESAHRAQYLCNEDWPMCTFRGQDFDEKHMLQAIDVAAAAGLEVFILDCPTWCSCYGKWLEPNRQRFPHGLAPLVDYAHAKGLLFGLYSETEGGRDGYTSVDHGCTIGPWRDSPVGREHPEWFAGRLCVLNLAIPAAAEYWEHEVRRIIEHHRLDLFRHDFNGTCQSQGSATRRGGFLESDYWRRYQAFLAGSERLRNALPNVIFQQASSGGDRNDLSVAAAYHEQFSSDCSIYPKYYRMHAGYTVFMPPEIFVSCHGMAYPKDLPDALTTLRCAYVLGQTPMIFEGFLPRKLSDFPPALRQQHQRYATLYKTFIRPLLPTCRVFHHAPVNATGGVESADWFAMEFASPDKTAGWAALIRLTPAAPATYRLKPRGLDPAKRYAVTFDNAAASQTLDGATLIRDGLLVQATKEAASELLLFKAVGADDGRTVPVLRQAAEPASGAALFPTGLPGKQFLRFPAAGFGDAPACGVIYRMHDRVTCGMPLGGIDTGCLDLETDGMLGYCTIFNTHTPRRGPLNAPLLGLSVGGKTWVLCDPQRRDGAGEFQPSYLGQQYKQWQNIQPDDKAMGHDYQLWRNGKWETTKEAVTPIPWKLDLGGVRTAKEIHYWGHYPVADLEFDSDAPVAVGLRAWSPFLPGDVVGSLAPAAVFEVHLRNGTRAAQAGTVAITFPGPLEKEARSARFSRQMIAGDFQGVEVTAPAASYALGLIGQEKVRTGGDLAASGAAWARIHEQLPPAASDHAGTSLAVDFSLPAGQCKVLRFVLSWYAPQWNAGGYNWAGAPHTFTHMYAKHYPAARQTAEFLAKNHNAILRRIIAWQKVVYTEAALPVWLRESLVNVLHLITETGLWAQAKPPLPGWVRPEDGLFGMIECPRGCPQIECIGCSFYGNQPLVYFFPQLALSTLRGYKGYQYPDGAPPWVFGGCTGSTPPLDFADPTRGYQFASNGISLAAMIDRYFLCYGERDKDFVKEFFPTVKQNMRYTVNYRPAYPLGDRIIAMPTGNVGTEWFEAPEPGWRGMTAHVGGLHLAQLRIAERMAHAARDEPFARQCAAWIEAGAKSMNEKLWTGSCYLNYLEPETKSRSDLIFGYQLDGQWITDQHGLPGALPADRVKTTLATIRRGNIAVTKYGAVNYVNRDGTPARVKGYGTYSYFPPEALMLAMTYMYEGEKEFGLELARKVWHNIVCTQGYTWDMPNIMRGDADTGERTFGNDYYQDMMLWSLPAAMAGKSFAAPVKPGGLVDRMIQAANAGN